MITLFIIDSDKEKEKYNAFINAENMASLLYNYAAELRSKIKYTKPKGGIQEASNLFWQLCGEYKIDPFEE